MTSKLLMPFALIGLLTSGAALAQDSLGHDIVSKDQASNDVLLESAVLTEAVETSEPAALAVRNRVINDLTKPAALVEFDGASQVLKRSNRLRITRPSIGYTITVGADGTPTSCKVTDRFRQAYTGVSLCRVMMDHHQFEAARDASGNAIEGTYKNRLYYNKLREEIAK